MQEEQGERRRKEKVIESKKGKKIKMKKNR
jgi:hypothetical protein